MIKEINGDLIKLAKEGLFEVIVHGCNCQGNMGKGIAKQIKEHFPRAAKIDLKGEIPGSIRAVMNPDGLFVVNAYTQIYYGKANEKYSSLTAIKGCDEVLVDNQGNRYRFIRSCMQAVNSYFRGKRIGLPLIGCGLAGGDWQVVKGIIEEELVDCDVTVVHFVKEIAVC